jgi:hypothetical protein
MISPFGCLTVIGQKREEKNDLDCNKKKKSKNNLVNKKRAKKLIGLLPAQPV